MEFKGTKGKLEIIEINLIDYFQISVVDREKNKIVCQIFDIEKQEAKANALLFSKANEILEKLKDIKDFLGSDKREEVEKLIKEATEIEK